MQLKPSTSSEFFMPLVILIGLIVGLSAWIFWQPKLMLFDEKDLDMPTSTRVFLDKPSSFFEVLDFFKEEAIFLSVRDDASHKMPLEVKERLTEMGSKEIHKLQLRTSYVAFIQGGKLIKEKCKNGQPVELSLGHIEVASAGNDAGNFSTLKIGKHRIAGETRGLNVYIRDTKSKAVLLYTFDFFAESAPHSKGLIATRIYEEVDQLKLFIKTKPFRKLSQKRAEALEAGILLSSEADFVPAQLIFQGNTEKVTLRLKGDWTDHLETDRWSFRVKMEGDKVLKGMRKFSLHHPLTRGYAGEWLFHQVLKAEDILHLKYEFVQVNLEIEEQPQSETRLLGIYALEESFDKYLLERMQRREGVILKIDENPIWEERKAFLKEDLDGVDHMKAGITHYKNLNILPFSEKKVLRDSSMKRQFLLAKDLFRAYLDGKTSISAVFDVAKLAKYNAICALFGAGHALIPANYRVFFNPVTSRFEPIGFDANGITKLHAFHKSYIYYKGIDDPIYMEAYVQALEEVIQAEYIAGLLENPDLKQQVDLLQKEFQDYKFQPEILTHNAKIIRQYLHPTKPLNIFLEDYENGKLRVSIDNFGHFPVRILDLRHEDGRQLGYLKSATIVEKDARKAIVFQMDDNFEKLFVSKKRKKGGFVFEKDVYKLRVAFQTLGSEQLNEGKVIPWKQREPNLAESHLLAQQPNAHKFAFLKIDEANQMITFLPGSWQLEGPLVLPSGYQVRSGGGVRIESANTAARIVSFSALTLVGSAENPIEFYCNNTGGQGLLVLETKDTSELRHCHFRGLSNVRSWGWANTGAVNFYNAPVKISHSTFEDNQSEDALNIIKTWFEIDNITISGTSSDAFDGDFVQGVIRNSHFENLGNDAIDVSGSDIIVENVMISHAGDKGLSAGENSEMIAYQVTILDSEIGVASKDQSIIKIDQLFLKNNNLGFTAFQKKPEFGPAQIEAKRVEMSQNELDYLIEHYSSLDLNNRIVETSNAVIERMYGTEFGKASN